MNTKLTTREFIFSQLLILVSGLVFLGTLYWLLYLDSPTNSKNSFFNRVPITKEPATLMLDITTPDDDLLIFKEDLEIAGKTLPGSFILVTSLSNNQVVQTRPDGSFSTDFELEEGINDIKIVSFDKNGDQKELERNVFYSKEKI